jgi:hypothetical protein
VIWRARQLYASAAGRRGQRDEMQDAHTIVHDLWACADPATKSYVGRFFLVGTVVQFRQILESRLFCDGVSWCLTSHHAPNTSRRYKKGLYLNFRFCKLAVWRESNGMSATIISCHLTSSLVKFTAQCFGEARGKAPARILWGV